MIHPDSIISYQQAFPDDYCGYAVPSSFVMIESSDGKIILSPHSEDDATFLDRIDRSKKKGRNLFYEEWPEEKLEPNVWH